MAVAIGGPDPACPRLEGIFDGLLVDTFVEREVAALALHDDQDIVAVQQLDIGPDSSAGRVAHPLVAVFQPQVLLGPSLVMKEPVEDALPNPLLGSVANRLVADQTLEGGFASVGNHRTEIG